MFKVLIEYWEDAFEQKIAHHKLKSPDLDVATAPAASTGAWGG